MNNDKKKKTRNRTTEHYQEEDAFLKFLAEIIVEIIIKKTSKPKNTESHNA